MFKKSLPAPSVGSNRQANAGSSVGTCSRKNARWVTISKIQSQWEFAVWLRELKLGLCDNLKRWDGEGGGREVQAGGDMLYF